ncbi:hypothetical protein [Rubellimicrobium mesophilum]|uniref:hypothetical protein n=1 Tax=Rubellimicrobium mesophilum TaxID=1123067 RepID=UPI0014702341|nr:hypothetical protein [Rubellimicrobium mesophilum]
MKGNCALNRVAYIAKLKEIRDQQVQGHIDLVAAFPRSSVREELPRLFSLYREIEELDRIIAAEEAKRRDVGC